LQEKVVFVRFRAPFNQISIGRNPLNRLVIVELLW
jgi:hypothetical protein